MPPIVPLLLFSLCLSSVAVSPAAADASEPQPDFAEGQVPDLGGGSFELVPELSDEFDGDGLNFSKWIWLDENWSGRPPAIFDASQVTVNDGQLWLTADRIDEPFTLHGREWTHRGALVGSRLPADVGMYTEARMKVNATFMSSTFWLMAYPTDTPEGRRSVELDIVECVGVDSREHPDDPNWTKEWDQHYWLSVRNQGPLPKQGLSQAQIATDGPITGRWRTFACWWKTETEIWFYIDGQRVAILHPEEGLPFNIPMRLRMVVETYDHNPPPAKGEPGSMYHPDGTKLSFEDRSTRYDYVRTWRVAE